jgi:hypothetical protein
MCDVWCGCLLMFESVWDGESESAVNIGIEVESVSGWVSESCLGLWVWGFVYEGRRMVGKKWGGGGRDRYR